MGVDYQTYIGPYIECRTEMVVVEKTKRSCTKPSCINHGKEYWDQNTKFCQECGSPIGEIKVKTLDEGVHYYDIMESTGEALFCTNAWGTPGIGPDSFGEAGTITEPSTLKALSDAGTVVKHYVISNRRHDAPKLRRFSYDPRHSNPFHFDMTDLDRQKEMDWLAQIHQKDIAVLKKMYGDDKVRIRWGIIHMVW